MPASIDRWEIGPARMGSTWEWPRRTPDIDREQFLNTQCVDFIPGDSLGFGTFAVEGPPGALANEVEPLGIRVTVVEPGPFRADFLSDASILPISRRIDDYNATAAAARTYAADRHGRQPGDPVRGAEAIIQALTRHPRCT